MRISREHHDMLMAQAIAWVIVLALVVILGAIW